MILVSTLVLASALISTAAAAESIDYQAVIRAQLEPVNSERFDSADLFMDGRIGKIDLTLHKASEESTSVSLEGAVSTVDHCGIITTKASKDHRPVDGPFTQITIRHNQNNSCPTFVALKAVEVVYERAYYDRIKGQEVRTVDNFATDNVALINPVNKGDVEFQGKVNSLRYDNKILTLNLSHSGGCKKHAFDLKWGECKKVKLLNSTIDQCDVTVLHTQGSDDMCEAYLTQDYQIDLSGLAQAYVVKIGNKKALVH